MEEKRCNIFIGAYKGDFLANFLPILGGAFAHLYVLLFTLMKSTQSRKEIIKQGSKYMKMEHNQRAELKVEIIF